MWAVLFAAYAILATGLFVVGRTQVAPCIAGSGTAPDIQQRCYESWLQTRGLGLQLLDSPIPAVALLVALVAITAWITRVRIGTAPQP